MNTAVAPSASGKVRDLMQHRLERALRQRVRYRYVRPRVLREGESFRIQSPCCSRNVDPSGGMIDIALLVPHLAPVSTNPSSKVLQGWRLCARDHVHGIWVPQLENETLDALLDVLCLDQKRLFWP